MAPIGHSDLIMKRKWWVIAGAMALLVVAIALVRANSRLLWSREFPSNPIAATLMSDGRLAVATGSSMEAIDRNGRAERLFSLPHGVVDLVPSSDGHLFAVADRRLQRQRVDVLFKLAWNGQVTWRHTNDGRIWQLRPTPLGGAALVDDRRSLLVVLDQNGSELWRERLAGLPPHFAMGATGQVALVRPSEPMPIGGATAESERARKSVTLPGGRVLMQPAELPRLTLVGANGNHLWTKPASPSRPQLYIDLEGRVAISEFGRLKLFDAEGAQLWEVYLPEPTSEAKAWLARAPRSYARSLDSLVADDRGNLFCQEQSGFVHAYSVDGKHRWSYWAAGGSACDDGLQTASNGKCVFPFRDWRTITNQTTNPLTGPVDYFSEAQGLICLNDRGEELWRCKLSGGLTLERQKNAFEWRAAWARRFGLRESLHFKAPLIAPDGTIYQIASGRGKSWVFAVRGDVE